MKQKGIAQKETEKKDVKLSKTLISDALEKHSTTGFK
jgi:hypothetical protein